MYCILNLRCLLSIFKYTHQGCDILSPSHNTFNHWSHVLSGGYPSLWSHVPSVGYSSHRWGRVPHEKTGVHPSQDWGTPSPKTKQESGRQYASCSPAWMQEAHCPPHSKCLLCCSMGGECLIHTWLGGYHRYPPLSHYPDLVGGYPGYPPTIQTWDKVPPPSRPGQGVPWVPPTIQTWDGVPPPTQTSDGVSPNLDLGWGTPLASVDRLKILPSLILRMRAVLWYCGKQ